MNGVILVLSSLHYIQSTLVMRENLPIFDKRKLTLKAGIVNNLIEFKPLCNKERYSYSSISLNFKRKIVIKLISLDI